MERMKNFAILVILACGVWNCGGSQSPQLKGPDSAATTAVQVSAPPASATSVRDTIPDFLQLGKRGQTVQYWFQGVGKSDSSGPYTASEFFSDTLSFELVYYPRNGDKTAVDASTVAKAAANNYTDLICFVFVYPMQDPDKMKDEHADNVNYPVQVKAYVRKGDHWELKSLGVAQDLTALSRFKIRCIYQNIK